MTFRFLGLTIVAWTEKRCLFWVPFFVSQDRKRKETAVMREKFQHFMTGRYGADDLSRVYIIATLVIFVISLISGWGILYWIGLALMIYAYWRMLSRNVSKRYEENQKYLNARYQVAVKWNGMKKRWAQRGTYRFYKCPQCRQMVRVPRGKGKICITCPKCRTEFIKKS